MTCRADLQVYQCKDICTQTWKELGFKSLDDFLVNFWEQFFVPKDPNNLLCMLSTWSRGNIGNTPGFDGGLEEALASIKVSPVLRASSLANGDNAVRSNARVCVAEVKHMLLSRIQGIGYAAEHLSVATCSWLRYLMSWAKVSQMKRL